MGIQEIVSGIATLAWLGAIAALGWVVFNSARGQRLGGSASLVVVIAVVAAVLSTVAAGIVFVQATQRGIVITAVGAGGIRGTALEPGLHWVIPFAEQVRLYDMSRRTFTMSSTGDEGGSVVDEPIQARTRDGQFVTIEASVIYSIDPTRIVDLHKIWQDRFQDGLVRPAARGVIRDVASQYGVEEIVSSRREEMTGRITEQLQTQLGNNNLILQEFVLRNITFSEEYANAVEQKQIAEQQAQQAAFVVEQRRQEAEQARQVAQGKADAAVIAAKGDAEARLIQAEAEAAALRQIADAIQNNQDLLTYQYIQRLAPGVQTIYLPSNQPFLLPLPQAGATTTGATTLPAPTTGITTTTP
jgi:regulator of protease activity HflC (stomatin/prohibitin superfamily)